MNESSLAAHASVSPRTPEHDASTASQSGLSTIQPEWTEQEVEEHVLGLTLDVLEDNAWCQLCHAESRTQLDKAGTDLIEIHKSRNAEQASTHARMIGCCTRLADYFWAIDNLTAVIDLYDQALTACKANADTESARAAALILAWKALAHANGKQLHRAARSSDSNLRIAIKAFGECSWEHLRALADQAKLLQTLNSSVLGAEELALATSRAFMLGARMHALGAELVARGVADDAPTHLSVMGPRRRAANVQEIFSAARVASQPSAPVEVSFEDKALTVAHEMPDTRRGTLFARMGEPLRWKRHTVHNGERILFENQCWLRIGMSTVCSGHGLFAERAFRRGEVTRFHGSERSWTLPSMRSCSDLVCSIVVFAAHAALRRRTVCSREWALFAARCTVA